MRKSVLLALTAGLVFLVALPAVAEEPPRIVRLQGWIVDEESGEKHANTESKDLVLQKQEEGVPLVFMTNKGAIHALADQEKALEKVGSEWVIIGRLDPDGTLTVGSFIPPKKKVKKAPAEEEAGAEAAAEATEEGGE